MPRKSRGRKPKTVEPPKQLSKAAIAKAVLAKKRRDLKKWSLTVRTRDGHRCQVCGATKHIQAHHILPKRFYKAQMLDLLIGISLCASHHQFSIQSAENNSIWFSEWLKENKPDQFRYCRGIIFGAA